MKSEEPAQIYPSLSIRAAALPFKENVIDAQNRDGSLQATVCFSDKFSTNKYIIDLQEGLSQIVVHKRVCLQ